MLIHIFYANGVTTTCRIKTEREYQEVMAMMQQHCAHPIPGVLLIETSDAFGLEHSSEVMKRGLRGEQLAPHPPLSI